MSKNYILNTYNKFMKLPFGKKLFSWYSARRAPYFSTVSPLISDIKPNYCEVLISKRKAVENHIGTVHVIAICNGLEMAMGFMCAVRARRRGRLTAKSPCSGFWGRSTSTSGTGPDAIVPCCWAASTAWVVSCAIRCFNSMTG